MFDGEIGDAAPRIELVRRGEGVGRARIEAGAALAAMIRFRRVGRQFDRQEQFAEEQPGAEAARHQVGVLALPAMARLLRGELFHQRRRVDEHLQALVVGVPDEAAELLQPALHHVVIVAALRIDRDRAAFALLQHVARIARRPVVQRHRHDGARLGPQGRGIDALLGAVDQPAHVALKAAFEERGHPLHPLLPCLGRQLRGREGHGVEAEVQRLGRDRVPQLARRRRFGRPLGAGRQLGHYPRPR